jgi:Ca-activated chloride channel homolog
MSFLNPSAAWWLLLAVPIVVFHMLRLRRRRVVVPSTLLWTRALEELEANAPLRRLRKSLQLLLQLLALLALVLMLMRPLWRTEAEVAGRTVLVVDTSASMAAVESSGATRLDQAKSRVSEVVDSLGAGDEIAIVESGQDVFVRSPMTSDRTPLRSALDAMIATDAPGRLSEAILLARELLRAEQGTEVVVLTDGAGVAEPTDLTGVRVVRVGEARDNVGVTAFTARPDTADPRRRQLFAAVESFSDRARSFAVELRVGGTLRDVREVALGPGARDGVVFDLDARETGMAEARLVPAAGETRDALASDDVAYAFLPDLRRVRVAAAVDDVFLLRALAANPRLDVSSASKTEPPPSTADVLVCERRLPPGWGASPVPLLALAPETEEGLWRVGGSRDGPAVNGWDAGHPVNAHLNFADLRVARAPSLEAPPWLRPIVRATDGGLVWAGVEGERRVVLVGFDPLESDLPLRVEFPLLLGNATNWLFGAGGLDIPHEGRAGASLTVRAQGDRALVLRPDGGSDAVTLANGVGVYTGADRVGLYKVEAGATTAEVGVSLLDPAESAIAPRDLSGTVGTSGGAPEGGEAEREVWPYLIPILVLLLLTEWVLYHRRIQ